MSLTRDNLKSWLKTILIGQELSDFTVEFEGTSDVGDGYLGDIFFIIIKGKTKDGYTKRYDLVAKCGKSSLALRELPSINEAYENEINMYKIVLPSFMDFQRQKNVPEVFDSFPRCYGTHNSENSVEIILLENLKKLDYVLCDKKQPLNINQINLVMAEYGKLHAISTAMKLQQPVHFDEITSSIRDVWKSFVLDDKLKVIFTTQCKASADVLDGLLDKEILDKWRTLERQISDVIEAKGQANTFKVVLHGDCWNNNFMFRFENSDRLKPDRVAFLDWQVSRLGSPVLDLSYFIFSCTSSDDLPNLTTIMKLYYDSFLRHGKLLGSDLSTVYTFDNLSRDWKQFACFGALIAATAFKSCYTEKSEDIDLAGAMEQGISFADMWNGQDLKNVQQYRQRLQNLIEYAVSNGLIP